MQSLQNHYTYMTVIPISNPSAGELLVYIFRQVKLELQTQFPASFTKGVYIYLKTDISQIHFFYKMIIFHKLFFYFKVYVRALWYKG